MIIFVVIFYIAYYLVLIHVIANGSKKLQIAFFIINFFLIDPVPFIDEVIQVLRIASKFSDET